MALVGAVIAVQITQDALKRLESAWLAEITDTAMDRLAEVLAKGGSVEEIERAIKAVLGDEDHAHMIAVTEANRAGNAGRVEVYRNGGVPKVRWITTSKDPCPICLANEAAGARSLGDPFPSGATAPPEHPNCQCELIPAE